LVVELSDDKSGIAYFAQRDLKSVISSHLDGKIERVRLESASTRFARRVSNL
jgi:hypothetical protein